MPFNFFIRSLKWGSGRNRENQIRRRSEHQRTLRARLSFEQLEGRTLLSGMTLVGHWDHQDDPNHQNDSAHLNADVWAETTTSGRFKGTYAYLGHFGNEGGVDIIDISKPSNPTLASVFMGTGGHNEIWDVQVQNGIGFFCAFSEN